MRTASDLRLLGVVENYPEGAVCNQDYREASFDFREGSFSDEYTPVFLMSKSQRTFIISG